MRAAAMVKTVDEYMATAAVMGMYYSPSSHTFYTYAFPPGMPPLQVCYDADTLEPLNAQAVADRVIDNIWKPQEQRHGQA